MRHRTSDAAVPVPMRHAARRLAVGLAAALILAACESTSQSARPSNGLPDITPEPLPTSASASPGPTRCPSVITARGVAPASITLHTPMGEQGSDLWLATITRLSDKDVTYEDHADPGTFEAGWVIGGAPLELAFEIESPGAGIVLTDLSTLYHPPGDASWAPLAVDAVGSRRTVLIPDLAGSSRLLVTAQWTDGCFDYRATVRFGFDVVPAPVVAACPSDVAGLDAILRAHDDDQVLIGSIARPIGTLSYEARYVPFGAGDQVGPFSSWDPAATPVDAATGELLSVADDDIDLDLSSGFARWYRLPDPDATTADEAVEAIAGPLEADASGRFQVASPDDEGRYILELSVAWELECLTGSGLSFFTVDVHPVVGSLPRPSV